MGRGGVSTNLRVLFGSVEELVVADLDGRQMGLLPEPRRVLDELHTVGEEHLEGVVPQVAQLR